MLTEYTKELCWEESMTKKALAEDEELLELMRSLMNEPTIINLDNKHICHLEEEASLEGRDLLYVKEKADTIEDATELQKRFLSAHSDRSIALLICGDFDKTEFTRAMDGMAGWNSPKEVVIGVKNSPGTEGFLVGAVAY